MLAPFPRVKQKLPEECPLPSHTISKGEPIQTDFQFHPSAPLNIHEGTDYTVAEMYGAPWGKAAQTLPKPLEMSVGCWKRKDRPRSRWTDKFPNKVLVPGRDMPWLNETIGIHRQLRKLLETETRQTMWSTNASVHLQPSPSSTLELSAFALHTARTSSTLHLLSFPMSSS